MDKIKNFIVALIEECNLNNIAMPLFKSENDTLIFSSTKTSIENINKMINNVTDNYVITQINQDFITIKIITNEN